MSKWDMPVCNIFKEMNFLLFEQETRCNRVHRGITPSFVKEPTVFIQNVEEVYVSLGSQPIEISNFEIRPLGGCKSVGCI